LGREERTNTPARDHYAARVRAAGLPRSVQVAGAQYGDDLVLRAVRVLELAKPAEVADLG